MNYRRHTGGFDADGNNVSLSGDPYAAFLLGQVNNTNFSVPAFPTISEKYWAIYVNDEFKVTNNLTLTLGLRYEYQSAIRDKDDNMSTFVPNEPNPGAGGLGGAMVFAGNGTGRLGTRTLEDPPRDAFGPRIGFAYRLGDKNVIRGGYGMYFSGVPHSQFAGVNNVGFSSNPTALDLTNGRDPAFYLDDGFPQENIILPPFIDPTIANGTSPVAITPDRATLPRIQNWSLTVQRQITDNMTLDVSYIGNRGSRLIADRLKLGPAVNMNDPAVLDLGANVLSSDINSDVAREAGITPPYEGFSGSVAQSLRAFPHMQTINYKNVPVGNSFFHSFQTKLDKRFSEGLQFRVNYTWSKLTGDGSESGQSRNLFGAGPQNPIRTLDLERGLSADDVPHSFLAAFTYQLPLYRGQKSGIAAKFLGGWAISGIFRIESARPVNILMANDLGNFLFNGQKRPNVLSDNVRLDGAKADIATRPFWDQGAFADPGPLEFGNASRTLDSTRGFKNLAEDFSFFKDTWINEQFKIRFEANFGNVFNRVVFCDPERNFSSDAFGRTFGQCNTPRSIQLALRLDF